MQRAAHRDRIVRLGWVDDGTRADLLAGASVFAYPSRYEGFALPPWLVEIASDLAAKIRQQS